MICLQGALGPAYRGSERMRAFAFICLAAAAPHKTGAPDAREAVRSTARPRRLSDDFEQLAKLIAADAAAGANFGRSVAVDGDTIVIGAPYAGTGGAVYVFRASDGKQLAMLTADDGAADDGFGYSVAIDGDTVVIGARFDDDGGLTSGSVYVFRKSWFGDTYSQMAKLTASDAAAGDGFGASVAIDGDTVVIGAENEGSGGAAYIFRTNDGWETYSFVVKLRADDSPYNGYFGHSVAIDGDNIVVGAYGDYHAGTYSGSAYVFRPSDDQYGGATYDQVAKLTASDAAYMDLFGESVAIDGTTVVVGAYGAGTGGAAYVFHTEDDGATYGQVAKLTATDAAAGDKFGTSVAVDGGTVAIGAWYGNSAGSGSGSAYVFRTSDGGATYGQVAKLTAADAVADDGFGYSVAIDGDTVVVGALYDGTDSGAAYIFSSDSSWWDYFSSDAATRPLPPAMVLLVAMLAL